MPAISPHEWQLVIAVFALVVALVGSIVNWTYTRKKFSQFTDPELDVRAWLKYSNLSHIGYALRNLHNAVGIAGIETFLFIRPRMRWFAVRRHRWRKICHKQHPPLDPLDSIEDDTLWGDECVSIEDGIIRRFPGHIEKLIVEGEDGKRTNHGYGILQSSEWELRFVVRFRGAISGSGVRHYERRFFVAPEARSRSDFSNFLSDWIEWRPNRVVRTS